MAPAIRLDVRAGTRARCSICHDNLGPLRRCAGCGTAFHADCREGLARCPSLGCRPGRRERSLYVATVELLGASDAPWPTTPLLSFVAAVAIGTAILLPNHPARIEEFVATTVLGYLGLFAVRALVAHVRGERGDGWKLHVVALVSSPLWANVLAQVILWLARPSRSWL